MWVCAHACSAMEARGGIDSSVTGPPGRCELPDMSTGNQT